MMKNLTLTIILLSAILCFTSCHKDDALAMLSDGEYQMLYSNPEILSAHSNDDTTYILPYNYLYLEKVSENSFNFHSFILNSNRMKVLPCVLGNVTTLNTKITFTKILPNHVNTLNDSCFINLQNDTGSVTILDSKFNKAGEVVGTCYAYITFRKQNYENVTYKCKTNFVIKKLN
jgi:hypothetical protein